MEPRTDQQNVALLEARPGQRLYTRWKMVAGPIVMGVGGIAVIVGGLVALHVLFILFAIVVTFVNIAIISSADKHIGTAVSVLFAIIVIITFVIVLAVIADMAGTCTIAFAVSTIVAGVATIVAGIHLRRRGKSRQTSES